MTLPVPEIAKRAVTESLPSSRKYFEVSCCLSVVDCVWNAMAHAQKPDVFRLNGRVYLNQFSRVLAAEVCASAAVMLDTPCFEEVWRVLDTHSIRQFPLHFPSRASPCAITFQLDPTTSTWLEQILIAHRLYFATVQISIIQDCSSLRCCCCCCEIWGSQSVVAELSHLVGCTVLLLAEWLDQLCSITSHFLFLRHCRLFRVLVKVKM